MPPRTLTVLALGPATNVARALQLAPDIAAVLRRVVLMGGALDGKRLDLNWMSDRGAAREVLLAPVPTVIVPIELCVQAVVRKVHVEDFASRCCPGAAACALLTKMRLQLRVMPIMVNKYIARRFRSDSRWFPSEGILAWDGFVPWDVVALFILTHPEFFTDWEYASVAIDPCEAGEPCSGTMRVVDEDTRARQVADIDHEFAHDGDLSASREGHRGLVRVAHRLVDSDGLVREMVDLMCAVPAREGSHPSMQAGFLPLIFGALVSVVALASAILCFFVSMGKRKKLKAP